MSSRIRSGLVAVRFSLVALSIPLAAACTGGPAPAAAQEPGTLAAAAVPGRSASPALSLGSLPVSVVNTTATPVPTQATGTTTVAGAVAATQSGAWSVGISGTPSVNATIAGTPSVNATIAGTPTVNVANAVTISGSVNVANASLPVTGSLGISSVATGAKIGIDPSANAVTLSGSPSVTLSGTPNVALSGTSTVAVDASQAFTPPPQSSQNLLGPPTFGGASKTAVVTVNGYEGRQPFTAGVNVFSGSIDQNGFASGASNLSLFGKRMVIEFLSAEIDIDPADVLFEALVAVGVGGGSAANVYFAPMSVGSDGAFQRYAASQSLRLYADDGASIRFIIGCKGVNPCRTNGFLSVAGYLIDP